MLLPIKLALRVLRKDPTFTAVAICSLAIGIGATSSMFSFADAMLLRPLPVRDPARVVAVNTVVSAHWAENPPISYPDYVDFRDHNRSFEGLAAASYAHFGFSADPRTLARMKWGYYVSGNFFHVMGVQPALGRDFRPDEDQAEGRNAVVILGHDFWVSQFARNPAVVGSRIRLNGVEFTVIGVVPEPFTGIDSVMRPQLFVPLAMSPRLAEQNNLHNRDFGWLFVKGRLKPGVRVEQARTDIESISAQLQKLHAQAGRDQRATVETELQFRIAQAPNIQAMVLMLGVLGTCVLLVACANVAGLLLSRARARTREIAVRLAIGAGRLALVRQLLLENLLVAAAGGLGGLWVADAVAVFWRRVPIPTDVPVVFDIGVDRRVLFFTIAASVLSTLLFGLAPAIRATRPDLVPALKAADADSAGKHRLWGRNLIVAGQVALSLVLLAVSAALIQGFRQQLLQGPGYRTDHLFLTNFDTQLAHYSEQQTQRFYKDLLDRTRSAAGVKSAALVSTVPMQSNPSTIGVVPDGWQLSRGTKALNTLGSFVTDGYFQTVGIPILSGRDFRESDREGAPLVGVVNEQMAKHYWPNTSALGRRFHLGGATGPFVEVVGIVKMSKYTWISEPPLDYLYLPYAQHGGSALSLVTQSEAPDAATLSPVVRDIVRNLDRDIPVFELRTMHDLYNQRAVKTSLILGEVVTGMGLMGLILAVVGLYALVAYSVSKRTREIGIRMAIGADRHVVVWMVLRQGLRLGVAGVAVGLVVGVFACHAVVSSLTFFGLTEMNPLIFVALAFLLLLITLLAAWAPARRAALIDPMRTLRDE